MMHCPYAEGNAPARCSRLPVFYQIWYFEIAVSACACIRFFNWIFLTSHKYSVKFIFYALHKYHWITWKYQCKLHCNQFVKNLFKFGSLRHCFGLFNICNCMEGPQCVTYVCKITPPPKKKIKKNKLNFQFKKSAF